MEAYEKIIGGRRCNVFKSGEGGGVLFSPRDTDTSDTYADMVADSLGDIPFTIVSFDADWDSELSPWRADNVFKGHSFAGGGRDVLNWLANEVVPLFPASKRYVGGYSLGGLFALWAYFECESFDGAASASGSLWYPGFSEYAEKAVLRPDAKIYLSLGDREEMTRNPIMAQVGDNTRAFAEKCENCGVNYVFEWNDGNHFRDTEKRTARAFEWVLR